MAYTTGIMNKRITIAQRYSDGMDAGFFEQRDRAAADAAQITDG